MISFWQGAFLTPLNFLQVCARLASHGDACILDGFEMFQWCLDSGITLSEPHMIQRQDPDTGIDGDYEGGPAYASMEQVLELTKALSSVPHVRPDIVTFNTLVEICAKSALTGGANLQVRPNPSDWLSSCSAATSLVHMFACRSMPCTKCPIIAILQACRQ